MWLTPSSTPIGERYEYEIIFNATSHFLSLPCQTAQTTLLSQPAVVGSFSFSSIFRTKSVVCSFVNSQQWMLLEQWMRLLWNFFVCSQVESFQSRHTCFVSFPLLLCNEIALYLRFSSIHCNGCWQGSVDHFFICLTCNDSFSEHTKS